MVLKHNFFKERIDADFRQTINFLAQCTVSNFCKLKTQQLSQYGFWGLNAGIDNKADNPSSENTDSNNAGTHDELMKNRRNWSQEEEF